MNNIPPAPQIIFAPAKVNLFLHVTGKADNGHHLLQSLITFADFGDVVEVQRSNAPLSLSFKQPHADLGNNADNLIIKAAQFIADQSGKPTDVAVTLTKNIPVGAGLGGGSADAAATIKGLLALWQEDFSDIKSLTVLGADVPVCYYGQSAMVEGIGENIIPSPTLPKMEAVLIYPNAFCSTAEIFKNFDGNFSQAVSLPEQFADQDDLFDFLLDQQNDLTDAAYRHLPVIKECIYKLSEQQGCRISRMSGSGSACFGLFETKQQSENAAAIIKRQKPDWWVRPVVLG